MQITPLSIGSSYTCGLRPGFEEFSECAIERITVKTLSCALTRNKQLKWCYLS